MHQSLAIGHLPHGSTITATLTGLPHHPRLEPRVASPLALAAAGSLPEASSSLLLVPCLLILSLAWPLVVLATPLQLTSTVIMLASGCCSLFNAGVPLVPMRSTGLLFPLASRPHVIVSHTTPHRIYLSLMAMHDLRSPIPVVRRCQP